jgi:hypothetical protein
LCERDGRVREELMTVALITIVLVVADGWLLYREPPKQRPGEALSKFDRLAQTVHELIQGRWYGKVAATVAVIVAGLLASTLFSSEPLTASTKTVTVTVTTKAATGTTGPPSTPTETATNPAPKPSRSVLGTWSGIVVDQDDASKKYRIVLVVQTTRIEADPAGTVVEKGLNGSKCEYLITATGKEGNAFTFAARDRDEYGYCPKEKISVERKPNGTVTYKSDLGSDADSVGTLRRG